MSLKRSDRIVNVPSTKVTEDGMVFVIDAGCPLTTLRNEHKSGTNHM